MSYTVRRQGFGPEVPFGKAGVAGAMAALFAVIGLMLPTGWLEAISFQMYLDTIVPTAIPPFGMVAHIVAGVLLALVGGLIGWGLARAFGVEASDLSFDGLLNRLRGIGGEDEADAPGLRAADRHPDAPARRPFSVAQDVPVATDAPPIDVAAAPFPAAVAVVDEADDGEDGELLLDAHFADPDPVEAAVVAAPEAVAEPAVADEPVILDEALPDEAVVDSPVESAPQTEAVVAGPVVPEPFVAEHVVAEPVAAGPVAADAAMPAPPRPVAEPIDVSTGRLDELLARLEAGLARRQGGVAEMTAPASAANDAAAAPAPDGDMPVPDDPALAAALATLRRMRQHVG